LLEPHAFSELFATLLILYAEIHYTLKGVFSRLRKTEPEIIADIPHRVERGAKLPVLIIVKDAHQHPIHLESVDIEIRNNGKTQCEHFDLHALKMAIPYWHRVLEISTTDEFEGRSEVDVFIKITQEGKSKFIKNDNYAATSHAPFELNIAAEQLPHINGWHFGEFHCHTNYTSDQVEFGAPLGASALLARAMGLTFFCATDHSYDLDDRPDNYLLTDPNLTKWKTMQSEIREINRQNADFVIVPGEEVSVGNHQNRNVHFIILNHPEFLPGAGDGAEKWLRTKPDLLISEVLDRINSNSVAFAAHPTAKPPFLEWLLVRRGSWRLRDCRHAGMHGLQIWNGVDDGLEEGKQLWIQLLLEGRRIFISGGNDAHGNFNRFRQIGWPFLTMRENHQHLFGAVRTGVLLENALTLDHLLEGFKRGRMVVTNGPLVDVRAHNRRGDRVGIGGEISGSEIAITCECKSTQEFGGLSELRLYCGSLTENKEKLLFSRSTFGDRFHHREQLDFNGPPEKCYFRAELNSERGTRKLLCLTNPIWLQPQL
jgi:hypothetical protein